MTIESNPCTTLDKGLEAIPRDVWALALVSLFMGISSEIIHSLLPLFLVSGLGVSATALPWVCWRGVLRPPCWSPRWAQGASVTGWANASS